VQVDVLFADASCPAPYGPTDAKTHGLGGTEAAVIRLAEGFLRTGRSVACYQHGLDEPRTDGDVTLLPGRGIENCAPRAVIHVRRLVEDFLKFFPRAKHVLWLHEAVFEEERDYVQAIKRTRMDVICVSDWHVEQACEFYGDNYPIQRIYNPVPDEFYERAPVPADPHKLIWMSSPHKGLDTALDLFAKLRAMSGAPFALHVYNPGYLAIPGLNEPGGVFHGPRPFAQVMDEIGDALCVFHPSLWYETFCLVAAEVNCLGIPVAGYARAALTETAQNGEFLKEPGDEDGILANVLDWSKNGRPNVRGNRAFKLSTVLAQWSVLLKL
jgi:glycosyltransferase involved in cell wall biosynthesis